VRNLDQQRGVFAISRKTVSGWENKPQGSAEASPEQVAGHSEQIGHQLTPSGGLDQKQRGGFSGKHQASHAEKQASVLRPNENIMVNLAVCDDCRAYFQKQAQHFRKQQIVADPNGKWVFDSDGTITQYLPGGNRIRWKR
jgi:hypothetical protein